MYTSSFSFFSPMASENSQIRIVTCAPSSYPKLIPKLALLLKECVDNNIVMNFIQPFSIEEGEKFWKDLEQGVNENKQFIIVALEGDPNEEIGKMLLTVLEEEARKHGRTILFLNTQTGSKAETFYERVGYIPNSSGVSREEQPPFVYLGRRATDKDKPAAKDIGCQWRNGSEHASFCLIIT
ncbi:hypothetical protein D9757_008623 [Collybiopsis confluens]|uniref:Uncharacterized protein n=1 Tax=Collybiopsis confluens TaxID=2823264 RepID=A0A8H5MAA5_9AGAR|nr:hypothetical protein D9757_008623 [Collybiopsis confluens]